MSNIPQQMLSQAINNTDSTNTVVDNNLDVLLNEQKRDKALSQINDKIKNWKSKLMLLSLNLIVFEDICLNNFSTNSLYL